MLTHTDSTKEGRGGTLDIMSPSASTEFTPIIRTQLLTGDDDRRMTGGWTDSSLTESGRRQADATGLALRNLSLFE